VAVAPPQPDPDPGGPTTRLDPAMVAQVTAPRPRAGSLASLFGPLNLRRAVLLAVFATLLVLFRHLLVLMVFFVAFQRTLTTGGHWLSRRTRLSHSAAAVLILLGTLALLGLGSWLGIDRLIEKVGPTRDLPERLAALKQLPIVVKIGTYVDLDALAQGARAQASHALGWAASFGHMLIFAFVGLIMAVVYLFEEPDLVAFRARVSPHSLVGTLLRWLGYAADAISVTLQFQVIVAAVNAVLTLPVLLIIGIPRAALFMLVVFVSGLIPVVGNFVSGLVLTLLAYQARGIGGAVAFVVLTFILHKIESYYLNPRLAARHVRLPGFVLIVSLLLWEQLIGFVGLFVSFPFLYLAMRIADEFKTEDEAVADAISTR
jgi:predicted PurR-regulated permease PerM